MQENLKHVAALYETAVKADLDLGMAASLSDDRLAELYNGCGPEWLPARIREKLTRLLALFEPAFLIHDCDYSAANGSTGDWAVANDRLEANCLRLANYTYPWYSWRRYRARLAALEIASLCRRYGWTAYVSAAKKLCAVLLVALALTGCCRTIDIIKNNDGWEVHYTNFGLKTDVSSIEAEKNESGTIKVKVKGVTTDVSAENKEVVAATGTAVGNIAEKIIEGVKK